MAETGAITGQAIAGLTVTGVEQGSDPTMPDYTQDYFSWEGHCWELVTDPDLDVALVRPGASPVAQEQFAARLANILRLNVANLYVTNEAVINQAVISRLFADIFAANKISTDQLAANSVTAGKIAAGSITGDRIQGNTITGDKLIASSITADKIAANAVTSAKIAANAITAGKIAADAISAEKIAGGSFSGKTFLGGEFEGAVIIGGAIATTRYPAAEGGIHIATNTGMRGWNNSGTQTFQLSPSTGEVSISAQLNATNPQNRGVILFPTTSAGGGGLWFTDDGTGSSNAAAVWRSSYTQNEPEPINIRGANGGHVAAIGGLAVTKGGVTSEYGISITKSGQDFYTEGGLTVRRPGSSSAAANAVIESTGNVRLRSSSRRYKRNIVDWSPDAGAVLKMKPRQWQHDDPNRPDIIDERWHVGFIAEEIDELGLNGLVSYAGDGKGGWRPESLNYERFPAAQQVVLQKHEQEIQDLRAENDELRSRLDTLTARLDAAGI